MDVIIQKKVGKLVFIFGIIALMGCCQSHSESVKSKTAGLNGGFEESKNGLPVNWIMFTPKTVLDSEFRIDLDRVNFKEGNQSLKFEVDKCSGKAGHNSPGFSNEFFEAGKFVGEGSYKISFWVKNNGTTFHIFATSVDAKKQAVESKRVIESNEQIDDWKYMELVVDVPKGYWLNMGLNILEPGTFWIDDVKIESQELLAPR